MAEFSRISIDQAHAALADDEDVAIVDLRDAMSYKARCIAGAINLNNDNVRDFLAATPRDRRVIVYCYHGNSSLNAAQFLVQQGFTTVASVDGGFEAWHQRYPQD